MITRIDHYANSQRRKDRTKISKVKKIVGWYDTGAPPQAWRKPRGVPIPDTQFSFGGEEDDGDEEEILSLDFHGSGPPS